jgi:hypothetical protein
VSPPVVQPQPEIIVCRVLFVKEGRAGSCKVVLADLAGVTASMWLDAGVDRPGRGQRVRVELTDRRRPCSWSPC